MDRHVLESAANRILEIAGTFSESNLSDEGKSRLVAELYLHIETLQIGFDERKASANPPHQGESDEYFGEKTTSLLAFAEMAVDPSKRDGYQGPQIIENTKHLLNLVRRMSAGTLPG